MKLMRTILSIFYNYVKKNDEVITDLIEFYKKNNDEFYYDLVQLIIQSPDYYIGDLVLLGSFEEEEYSVFVINHNPDSSIKTLSDKFSEYLIPILKTNKVNYTRAEYNMKEELHSYLGKEFEYSEPEGSDSEAEYENQRNYDNWINSLDLPLPSGCSQI